MTTDTPIQKPRELVLGELLSLMARHPDMSEAAHAYISGDARTLDEAMGIGGGPGIPKLRTVLRHRWRDTHLNNALELLGGDLEALSSEIGRFTSRKWPVWEKRDTPPERATAIEIELFQACRLNGRSIPGSPRHLRRLVT